MSHFLALLLIAGPNAILSLLHTYMLGLKARISLVIFPLSLHFILSMTILCFPFGGSMLPSFENKIEAKTVSTYSAMIF